MFIKTSLSKSAYNPNIFSISLHRVYDIKTVYTIEWNRTTSITYLHFSEEDKTKQNRLILKAPI